MDGRRTRCGASILSFNNDTRRPEEFLPSIFSLGQGTDTRQWKECDQIRSGTLALAREGKTVEFGAQ